MSAGRRDALVALALFAASVLELAIGDRANLPALTAAALITLPLAWRLRWPWIAYGGVAAGFTLLAATGREPDATGEIVALWVVAYTLGARPTRQEAIVGLVAVAAPLVVDVVLEDPLEILWVMGVFVLPPWVTGRLMYGRQERIRELHALHAALDRERELTSRLAAQLERARLAVDIQLVLAASLRTIRDLAARGREAVGDDDEAAARAFDGIRAAGSQATGELRRLLGVLREGSSPADRAR